MKAFGEEHHFSVCNEIVEWSKGQTTLMRQMLPQDRIRKMFLIPFMILLKYFFEFRSIVPKLLDLALKIVKCI